MSIVVLTTMVQETIAQQHPKKLHPLFSKAPATELPNVVEPEIISLPIPNENEPSATDTGGEERGCKRPQELEPMKNGIDAKKRRRRSKKLGSSLDGSILSHLSKPLMDNLASLVPEAAHIATEPEEDMEPKSDDIAIDTLIVTSPPKSETPPRPKRVLRFNAKTGTLGSPPKPKQESPPSRIVSIKYGKTEEQRTRIGALITQIIDGTWKLPEIPPEKPKRKPGRPPKHAAAATPANGGSKAIHPLLSAMMGGENLKSDNSTEVSILKKPPRRRDVVFMSTPVSPRKPAVLFAPKMIPQFGFKVNGTKVPGSLHPLWPPLGMAHIRGYDVKPHANEAQGERRSKKSKGQVTDVTASESVLRSCIDRVKQYRGRPDLSSREDNHGVCPASLRLPRRHFESGRDLQRRVRPQLRNLSLSFEAEEHLSQDSEPSTRRTHPVVGKLWKSLETQLSSYDRSTCENSAWVNKYAPLTAVDVLQSGKEATILRDWVAALKVQAVATGATMISSQSKSEGAPKKKRRKKELLDDFIVDSDEDADGLNELSDCEEDWTASDGGVRKKTVVHARGLKGFEQARIPNAVVISGSHGCGKTAAVYAIAKELGFEVFEVSSNSRRSGKDLLEKVGDMTRNHLVQQHRADESVAQNGTDAKASEEIKPEKQKTMTAFFKGSSSKKVKKKDPKNKSSEDVATSTTAKNQKQSLILVEEVDILYEEDKQFWATLMVLIAQSKRPFILTCNDENLVPLHNLNLYAILRFTPPPVVLAVDVCLLIAANEGHALQRRAVESLYQTKQRDFRATITELNYWCQLGVGDRRGGFDWFYLRWPPGSDLDQNGDVVRVISEDTFRQGMDVFGRDPIVEDSQGIDAVSCELEREEELLLQAWMSGHANLGDEHQHSELQAWIDCKLPETSRATQRAMMVDHDGYAAAMSDADIFAERRFGTGLWDRLDPSVPDMNPKVKDDFTIGRGLLEAELLSLEAGLTLSITTSIKSRARQTLAHRIRGSNRSEVGTLAPLTEQTAVSMLESQITSNPKQLTRYDIALAFDPIAVSAKSLSSTSLDASVFDRTLRDIVLDVAPWIRGIVAYDNHLMAERLRLSNLLSEGGGSGSEVGGSGKRKRMRQTRSAYSALEGGERKSTRRERYFGGCLTTAFVERTGGAEWMKFGGWEGWEVGGRFDGASSPVSMSSV